MTAVKTTTRKQALERVADVLDKAENTVNQEAIGKFLSLGQLYLALAHEIGETTPFTSDKV